MKEEKEPSVLRFPGNPQAASQPNEPLSDVVENERKIWDWLGQHTRLFINLAAVVLLISVITFVFRWMNEQKAKKCLQEYRTQTTLADRLKWAEKGSLPSSLKNTQGFVFLEQANESMHAKAYEKAMLYYQKAKKCLQVFPLHEQATISFAYAALQANQFDTAEKELQAIYACKSPYLRAQALYALCFIAGQRKDAQQLNHYKMQLKACEQGELFLSQIEAMFPESQK